MIDKRLETLSRNLINYSCELKKGEKVIIEVFGPHYDFTRQLVREAHLVGALPVVWLRDSSILREQIMGGSQEQWDYIAASDAAMLKEADAYIGIRGGDNSSQYSDISIEKLNLHTASYNTPVHSKVRVPDTRWVVLRFPSPSMAQQADQSTESFEDFYFNVCNLDYGKMSIAMNSIVSYMKRTDKVRITGKGTDITFSIKDIPAIKCDGKVNIPDGEIFVGPVKDSVNGTITYNTPSLYQGFTFENISFTFKDGKIISHSSNNDARIEDILNTDEGARYIGEFAIGVNPYINKAMKDTLFDEKISGSIHLTPGNCYDDSFNGNKSAIHWDLVFIQTPEFGGGEIYFDDVLIRKDGLFVVDELKCLNPDQLI